MNMRVRAMDDDHSTKHGAPPLDLGCVDVVDYYYLLDEANGTGIWATTVGRSTAMQ